MMDNPQSRSVHNIAVSGDHSNHITAGEKRKMANRGAAIMKAKREKRILHTIP